MDQKETKTPKRQITIAGKNGAGKSTVNKLLIEALPGYESYSTGDFMRSIAAERGLTLDELQDGARTDTSIDEKVDNLTLSLAQKEDFILDSRIGFHFLPQAFVVFLDCPEEIAAERIVKNAHKDDARVGESIESVDVVTQNLKNRHEGDRKRYQNLYGIENHLGHENFDFVIDTSVFTPEEVRDQILEAYQVHLAQE